MWLVRLLDGNTLAYLPAITDYEVRRELLRMRATGGLVRLNALRDWLTFLPLRQETLEHAAALWAEVRRAGIPTASPEALDADCILAA